MKELGVRRLCILSFIYLRFVSSSDYTMSNELERMWEEILVAKFEIPGHFPGGTEDNHKINLGEDSQFPNWDLNLGPPKYGTGMPATWLWCSIHAIYTLVHAECEWTVHPMRPLVSSGSISLSCQKEAGHKSWSHTSQAIILILQVKYMYKLQEWSDMRIPTVWWILAKPQPTNTTSSKQGDQIMQSLHAVVTRHTGFSNRAVSENSWVKSGNELNYYVSGHYPSSCFYLKHTMFQRLDLVLLYVLNRNRAMDNVQKHNNCINIPPPPPQTFRSWKPIVYPP
jgi:hypothetical protein